MQMVQYARNYRGTGMTTNPQVIAHVISNEANDEMCLTMFDPSNHRVEATL